MNMRSGGLPGTTPTYAQQLLFVVRGANMQSTADQAFTKVFGGTNYVITNVVAINKTGGASVACAGGIYTAASKGGDALVAAVQSWVALAAAVLVTATLAAIASTKPQSATPFLNLTTGSTAACTADIFVYGFCID